MDDEKKDQERTDRIQLKMDVIQSDFLVWQKEVENKILLLQDNLWELDDSYADIYQNENYALFVFKNDVLKYWSNSHTAFHPEQIKDGIQHLNNGWYYVSNLQLKEFQAVFLLQLSEEYPVQNRYLDSKFLVDRSLTDEVVISDKEISNYSIRITDVDVFYLDYSQMKHGNSFVFTFNVITFLLLIASLLFLWKVAMMKLERDKKWYAYASMLFIVLLRVIWLNNPFPSYIQDHAIFDPSVFAQSYLFPSLADLLINAMLLLAFTSVLLGPLKDYRVKDPKQSIRGLAIVFFILNIFILYGLNAFIEGLVYNSRIPFNIDHLFELDIFSVLAMFGIAILFLAYYKFLHSIIQFLYKNKLAFSDLLLVSITCYALYAAYLASLSNFDMTTIFWSLPIVLATGIVAFYQEERFTFGINILIVALFSLFLSHSFELNNLRKEQEIRKVLGERLAQTQDPIKEFQLNSKLNSLKQDPWLQELFLKDEISDLEYNEIILLFGNDWIRYKKEFVRSNKKAYQWEYDQETPPIFESLFQDLDFFHGPNWGVGYCFSIPIIEQGDSTYYLQGKFTELSRPISSGFPELLRSESNNMQSYAGEYDYARYYEGQRIFSSDESLFPYDVLSLSSVENYSGYIDFKDQNLLILPDDYGFTWVIARQNPQLLQRITSFSYLFLYLGVLSILLLLFYKLTGNDSILDLSLRSKIQLIFIAFILVVLTAYAFVIFNQITAQFHERNKAQISERLNSINIELGHKLGHLDEISEMSEQNIQLYLMKFSEVFVADISLFDLNGEFSATSSSMIWDKNLLSYQMDPDAFKNLALKEQANFIHEESIGDFNFLSGYRPLYNDRGEKIAYLNVPYFTRQDELAREISRFLQILINVFVLLMGASVIVAIYVSNWITSPLKMLQSSFSSLDLINRNEPIEYRGNDELASLVNAYNQKVKELERITEQIVRSEKEHAWQEMARQIAHEIKNPLTPMRLSIQHYQRLLDQDQDGAMERTPSLMKALIEQIDNLAHIANEFSQFSQIAVSKQITFDLNELLHEVHELYTHADGIELSITSDGQAMIKADRGQLMRMMNNLVQNAIQATKDKEERRVLIVLKNHEDEFIITVKDNGKGIDPEIENKIFQPNFTTKSKGMGLGLAIVHTIVKNHSGDISFKSVENEGTSFIVSLPIYR